MAALRSKRKLAAVTRETQEEHPRNGQSRNTSVPRINEEYISQVSEEIEGRVTKKLSQEYSRTESRFLGALSKLDDFLLNQQIRMHSGTVPETFRNTNVENQGTNEEDSQSDPHPEAGIFRGQTTQNSGPEVGPYTCWVTKKHILPELIFIFKSSVSVCSKEQEWDFLIFMRKTDDSASLFSSFLFHGWRQSPKFTGSNCER